MTAYGLNRFTAENAQPLIGRTADITFFEDAGLNVKISYAGAWIVANTHYCLVIESAGAGVVTDAESGERLGLQKPVHELSIPFPMICDVSNLRATN